MRRVLLMLLPLVSLVVAGMLPPATSDADAAPACTGRHWVGTWAAAPSDAGFTEDHGPARPLAAQTLRMVVHPTLPGRVVRIHLTNRYGDAPITVGAATVARRARGASAVDGTMRVLSFDGGPGVTLEPGGAAVSDPVHLPVRLGRDLLVSLHLPDVVTRPTGHFITNQTNYLSPSGAGDNSADLSGDAFPLTTQTVYSMGWWLLSGVDVMKGARSGAVVAFGDSITDGFQGLPSEGVPAESPEGMDANARYPDFLASRLAGAGLGAVGVLNAGVSGNKVLTDADAPYPFGPAALQRFAADTELAGASSVIVLEGINDLGTDDALTARRLEAGLRDLVHQAHAEGLRVYLATLTPTRGASDGYGTAHTDRRRRAVNRWIRSQHVADGVVDFDRAVRDPEHPSRLLPAYDSGDHLHPSSAGYLAMADAVPLSDLALAGCG